MIYRAITFVAYLKMKSLEALREWQWNVIQVIVSDIKMLKFMQILEDEGKRQGEITDIFENLYQV